MVEKLEKLFKLKENKTTVKTEVFAGITIFMTMSYILAVNPNILSVTGMDAGAVFTATVLASMIGTILMALLANYPFALAPGMGLNAYFAYTVCLQMGYSWKVALAAVFTEGIIFIVLSLTKVRESVFNAIPKNLKIAVSAGIGLFITFIGLLNAKIVVLNESTCVALNSFDGATFSTIGITVILAIIGLLITGILISKNVKGSILIGIIATWFIGMICQVTGLYVPNPELGMYSLFPDFSNWKIIPSISSTFLQFDFTSVRLLDFIVIVFSFLFVDFFDTVGTLTGGAIKGKMLNEKGELPKAKQALLADAVATTAGACLGTSTTTTFVESTAGISEGGRTGLTALVTAGLFGLSLFFSPIFLAIPSFATAPALIIVGFLMFAQVTKIDFSDYTEAIPCFLCIMAMPLFYSIAEGIGWGIISYVILNIATKKRKKVTPIMIFISICFILKYIFL